MYFSHWYSGWKGNELNLGGWTKKGTLFRMLSRDGALTLSTALTFLFGDRFPQSLFMRTSLYLGICLTKKTYRTLHCWSSAQIILNTAQWMIWNVQCVIFGCQVCYANHSLIFTDRAFCYSLNNTEISWFWKTAFPVMSAWHIQLRIHERHQCNGAS